MHRVDTEGHDGGLFRDGDPQLGQQGTELSAAWLNDVQENLVKVIIDAGIALVKGDHTQLKAAIAAMITSATAGARTIGEVKYISGSAVPAGFLKANGQLVTRAAYPDLWAWVQTSGNLAADNAAWLAEKAKYGPGDGVTNFNLPDYRGEFLRVWDDGRGVDVGRAIGTSQASQNLAHSHNLEAAAEADGTGSSYAGGGAGASNTTVVDETLSSGGNEARPRNVTVMAVIRY